MSTSNFIWSHLSLTWNRGPQSNKYHSGDWILKSNGAAKVWSEITRDRRQHANQTDGHNEARPSVPILRGWHECKENLPEDREEVHDVVKAGWKTLFTALLLIVIPWWVKVKQTWLETKKCLIDCRVDRMFNQKIFHSYTGTLNRV